MKSSFVESPTRHSLIVGNRLLTTVCFVLACLVVETTAQLSWSEQRDVAPSGAGNLHPRIVLDAVGNPIVLFGQAGTGRVRIARWNGSQFVQSIVNDGTKPAFYENWAGPDIAAKGDTIYVVFKQTPEEKNHVYCCASFDGARTFAPPVRVDTIADSLSRFPCVAIDDAGNPLVGFMKFNATYEQSRWAVVRSVDAAKSFQSDTKASGFNDETICDCCPGSIIAGSGMVIMAYRNNASNIRDTWIGISEDGARSFKRGENIDNNGWKINACPATGPDVALVGDSLYSVFCSAASGKSRVYHSVSALHGAAPVKAPTIVTTASSVTLQNYPRLSANNRSLIEAWVQNENSRSYIMTNFTADRLKGYADAAQSVANADLGKLVNVDVAISNSTVYVVYQDDARGTIVMRSAPLTANAINDEQTAVQRGMNIRVSEEKSLDVELKAAECGAATMELWSEDGRCVARGQSQSGFYSFDVSQLSAGLYLVRVQMYDGHIVSRSVVLNFM